jgi:hypothetical protein
MMPALRQAPGFCLFSFLVSQSPDWSILECVKKSAFVQSLTFPLGHIKHLKKPRVSIDFKIKQWHLLFFWHDL